VSDTRTVSVSIVGFAVAMVTVTVGVAAGLTLIPVAGSFVGMALGGFVAGLALEERPLVEAGGAAALASLGLLMVGPFIGNGIIAAVLALGSIAPATLLGSVVLSFAVGAFGAHFGDDLREGLTAPLEEPPVRRRGAVSRAPTETDTSHAGTDSVGQDADRSVADEPHGDEIDRAESDSDLEVERN